MLKNPALQRAFKEQALIIYKYQRILDILASIQAGITPDDYDHFKAACYKERDCKNELGWRMSDNTIKFLENLKKNPSDQEKLNAIKIYVQGMWQNICLLEQQKIIQPPRAFQWYLTFREITLAPFVVSMLKSFLPILNVNPFSELLGLLLTYYLGAIYFLRSAVFLLLSRLPHF